MLLTNDGELARHLELPSTGWTRRYRVRVHGDVSENKLAPMRKGITWEGIKYEPAEVEIESTQRSNSWLSVALTEGKNREVRNLMTSAELQVNRLIRVSYGPFQLGKLPPGGVKEVSGKVIREQIKGFGK